MSASDPVFFTVSFFWWWLCFHGKTYWHPINVWYGFFIVHVVHPCDTTDHIYIYAFHQRIGAPMHTTFPYHLKQRPVDALSFVCVRGLRQVVEPAPLKYMWRHWWLGLSWAPFILESHHTMMSRVRIDKSLVVLLFGYITRSNSLVLGAFCLCKKSQRIPA